MKSLIKTERRCKICYDKIPIIAGPNVIYCDKSKRNCYFVAQRASKRVLHAQQQYKVIMLGKICTRCKNRCFMPGMRKYCKECSKLMRKTGGYVKKPPKEPFMTKCKECHNEFENPNKLKKLCPICKPIVSKRLAEKGTREQARKAKEMKLKNEKTKANKNPINPKWLSRNYEEDKKNDANN